MNHNLPYKIFRTLIFYLILFVNTTIGGLMTIVVGLFQPYSRFSYENILKPWARSMIWASGNRLCISGEAHMQPDQSYVVICNHASHFDIPALLAALPNHTTIIAKKELFGIPGFAHSMRALGILEIDRTNRHKAISTLNEAGALARERNISILAFAEGTRSKDGQLMPFKKGPFMLALTAQLPILPVSVKGTYPIMSRNTLMISSDQTIEIKIHPPISVALFSNETRDELIETTFQTIAAGYYAYET